MYVVTNNARHNQPKVDQKTRAPPPPSPPPIAGCTAQISALLVRQEHNTIKPNWGVHTLASS